MSQSLDLLDLSITLTNPPQDAPTEAIASITLRSDPQGLTHIGDLLTDPLTQQERNELRWYLEEYPMWPYYEFAERAKQIEALLSVIGKRLYQAVFGGFGAMGILQAWRLQPAAQRQISIVSDIPRALSLPWELLHDEQGFLALRTRHPVAILRRLQQRELAELATPFEPPLRVLLVTARPTGTGFLDPRGLARELLDEIEDQVEAGTMVLEFLRPPTLAALRTRLKDTKRPVHILHFDGHGVFEGDIERNTGQRKQGGEQGKLAFEDADGKLDLVQADDLAQVLQDSGVKLAVLDACQSAMGAADDAFSSVAARLIQGGVDATVAMSASVLVATSTSFFEMFYRELIAGTPAPIAQERARQALHDDPHRHLFRRSRDEEGQPVELRDWWLPHFYQQRPLALQATRPARKRKQPQPGAALARLNTDMPPEPRYGFSGRAYELLQLERQLLRNKLIVISGFGGVGKTALVREAADWLTRTGMYTGACFVSFEHGGESATLLSALGTYLGVYDGLYQPSNPAAALARLKPALHEHPTLVIADNLESILHGGEAPLEIAARGHLWGVLLDLARLRAGVLLTTRTTDFGDGRLSPGDRVAHLALGGLSPEDAYALATHVLADLGIERTRTPYTDLRDLLAELDHHPLSIQLVLPALHTIPLATIRAEFASLLPRFADDHETGRNSSLLASLDYSLRRLSEAQRGLLPRLALFEGGASEDDLLAITQIPESEWAKLRQALEQAALLTAEHVEGFTVPFLHFHPVLAPYLRGQYDAGDAALRDRYVQHYYRLAGYLRNEDDQHPQEVRALVQKELPNLRRVLELLLEAGDLEASSVMADRIAYFLASFGLLRERDELRRRVGEAVAAKGTQVSGGLTHAEWLREKGLGEDEYYRGKIGAAHTRFTTLLARIEALPEGAPLGRGSYDHCLTLLWLARCLESGGQPAAAEGSLRKALAVIEALIGQEPENKVYLRQRGLLLAGIADLLTDQGKYAQAREVYEEALEIAKRIGDVRQQGVVLGQLGTLALEQRDYEQAQSRYTAALQLFQTLGEPASEATAWHLLGSVAQEQQDWAEAERYYRESLKIKERLGDAAGAAMTCNMLAIVAAEAGRPVEAEGWWKRALEMFEQADPGGAENANILNNLARLLVNEVRAGHAAKARLAEAKRYAEQALAIKETLDAAGQIWNTLNILAEIADLEGRVEEARDYRRRERETFAAFAGNRYHIDRQLGQVIAAIAAAAQGNAQAREAVEAKLPQFEERGWKIAAATRRIWSGERDWASLVEEVDRNSALLILRVLETIAQPTQEPAQPSPEEVFTSLPPALREALAQGDEAAFQQAMEALSPQEQQIVVAAIRYLQAQAGEESEQEE